eukprot:GFKZ01014846.1.p1 GENE.GFKZ01014846.1~~GFKZ01014846.1.p1  ORF type:complete len:272 (-),score=27.47 GFKZ01014846.1:256-1071(-)
MQVYDETLCFGMGVSLGAMAGAISVTGGVCRLQGRGGRAWDVAPRRKRQVVRMGAVTRTKGVSTGRETKITENSGVGVKEKEKEHVGTGAEGEGRFEVREARVGELYAVADIRCEAFYGAKDVKYYPVRRREIYVTVRDRVMQGNRCLVVVDTAGGGDGIVVASCDVAMYIGNEGVRVPFGSGGGGARSLYVSSMAVREAWRGRGLAQSLLRVVKKMGRDVDGGAVFLHVEWENGVAVHVYRKCGFEVVATAEQWLARLAKREHTLMKKVL